MRLERIRHYRNLAKSAVKKGIRFIRNASLFSRSCHPIWGPVPGVKALSNPPIYSPAKQCPDAIEFSPAWKAARILPEVLEGDHAREFLEERTHDLPPSVGVCLNNGRILGSEGVVFDEYGFLIAEPSRKIGRGLQDWSELYSLKRPKPIYLEGKWGVLTGAGSKGYFHWMLDVLPKAEIIRTQCSDIDGWIIPKFDGPFVAQSLDLAGISGPFCPIDDIGYIIAENAIVASIPSESGNPPTWVRHFYDSMGVGSRVNTQSRKIYVSRAQTRRRRILNENDLLKRITPYGYEKVQLEDLSVAEQIALFRSAKSIIAPHGAGLTNVVFAPSGTRILEIFSEDYVNVCYWALGCISNMDYAYITTPTIGKNNDPCTTDIELPNAHITLIENWAKRE
jgi:hypothetical protein